jgi:hypothetical protein
MRTSLLDFSDKLFRTSIHHVLQSSRSFFLIQHKWRQKQSSTTVKDSKRLQENETWVIQVFLPSYTVSSAWGRLGVTVCLMPDRMTLWNVWVIWEVTLAQFLTLSQATRHGSANLTLKQNSRQSFVTLLMTLSPWKLNIQEVIGLGAFTASELDKVFSGYQPH